jgi:S1-C subfamily serine protease
MNMKTLHHLQVGIGSVKNYKEIPQKSNQAFVPKFQLSSKKIKTLNHDTLSFKGKEQSREEITQKNKSTLAQKTQIATLYIGMALSALTGIKANLDNNQLEQQLEGVQNELIQAHQKVEGISKENATLKDSVSSQEQMIVQLQSADTKINLNVAQQQQLIDHLQSYSLDRVFDVVNEVSPSTVRVELPDSFGSGGIIFDQNGKGYIITNAHVTGYKTYNKDSSDDNFSYKIKLFSNGDYNEPFTFEAKVLTLPNGTKAESKGHDLAILEIPDDVVLPENVKGLHFRNIAEDPVKPGELTVIFGNPWGLKDSVAFGFVSSSNRKIRKYPDNKYIQLDGAINPGNSGGVTVDREGNIIGINQLKTRDVPNGDGNNVSHIISAETVLDYLKNFNIKLK